MTETKKKQLIVDLEHLSSSKTNTTQQITKDLDLSSTSCSLPAIFTDYYLHTGPLRADPPPVSEWILRIPDNYATIKNKKKYNEKLKDCTICAETCRRAQKWRQCANCYMSMGIIYDNCKEYKMAIASYKKFIKILTRHCINRGGRDAQQQQQQTETIEFDLGLYAAYNALGVDYHLLAEQQKKTKKKCTIKYFEQSLEHHLKYRDCIMETESNIMNDTNCNSALFIAYTNIGLLLLRCNRILFAINQFQHALRYSIHINSNIAQSIAICNLSLAHVSNKKFLIGRACMERYLQLVTVLGDAQSQCYAFYNLGTMIVEQNEEEKEREEGKGNVSDAINFFEEAIKICQYIGDKPLKNQLKMKLAVATILQTKV